ncbi:uncharacterized protein [Pyrus communis]|uniref:uncharacterized protein n=1 Tax=Pyrus communis TaxID=23211 RepID=UPI0035BF4B0C
MVEGGDFLECWKWLCRKYDDIKDAGKLKRWIVCGLWRIWKCGDSVIFEKLALEPRVALALLHQQWRKIEKCGGDKVMQPCFQVQGRGEIGGGWTKPPFQTIKLNCGGAWCKQTGQGGFGWVARLVFKEAGGAGNILCESSLMADVEAMRAALLACWRKALG